ncbi:RagB/SusD family nutrient uptake outer membrane protein [Candidatus Pelagibacter sp.]|nr:RagB/SusD family nutrient uptake outer membrane protein [Candidatus Pelagibacter sp.]
MKKIIGTIFISLLLLTGCDSASVPVKKSKTNICHKKGSKYYDQTKHFRAFNTIKECIDSGGRLPKKK